MALIVSLLILTAILVSPVQDALRGMAQETINFKILGNYIQVE